MSQLLVKENAPALYKLVKPIVPHLSDPRADKRGAFLPECWDPWNEVWEEYKALEASLDINTRPEWVFLLEVAPREQLVAEFLTSLGIEPDDSLGVPKTDSFSIFFPIISYVLLAHGSYQFFRALLVSGEQEAFDIAPQLPEEHRLSIGLRSSDLRWISSRSVYASVRLEKGRTYSYRDVDILINRAYNQESEELFLVVTDILKTMEVLSDDSSKKKDTLSRLIGTSVPLSFTEPLRRLLSTCAVSAVHLIGISIALKTDIEKFMPLLYPKDRLWLLSIAIYSHNAIAVEKLTFPGECMHAHYLGCMNDSVYTFSKSMGVSWTPEAVIESEVATGRIKHVYKHWSADEKKRFCNLAQQHVVPGGLSYDYLQFLQQEGIDLSRLASLESYQTLNDSYKNVKMFALGVKVPVTLLDSNERYAMWLSDLYSSAEIDSLGSCSHATISLLRLLTLHKLIGADSSRMRATIHKLLSENCDEHAIIMSILSKTTLRF